MANIQFKALGKKTPVNLNVRFYHNKIDCSAKSNIFVDLNHWSSKTNKVKQNTPPEIKKHIEETIQKMSEFIMNSFIRDFPIGETINTKWIVKQVDKFYMKPESDVDPNFYFVPFIKNYIEESKTRVNPRTGNIISESTLKTYRTTLARIIALEDFLDFKFKIKDIGLEFHSKYTSYAKDQKYGNTVIEKDISIISAFIKAAKIKGLETNVEVESNLFSFIRDKTIDTFLDNGEIELVYNLDLSDNLELDNVRDLFIVGLWTGLRISDLKRINSFDFSTGNIRILETEKTNAYVEIPVHEHLKAILIKRNGQLPEMSDQHFNRKVKDVCEKAGITKMILGNLKDPQINRKVKGFYPKYKLISSHTCRRSFISNHYGKISDKTLMSISAHKSVAQFLSYVKTSSEDQAKELSNLWANERQNKKVELENKEVKNID
jgi:integrase